MQPSRGLSVEHVTFKRPLSSIPPSRNSKTDRDQKDEGLHVFCGMPHIHVCRSLVPVERRDLAIGVLFLRTAALEGARARRACGVTGESIVRTSTAGTTGVMHTYGRKLAFRCQQQVPKTTSAADDPNMQHSYTEHTPPKNHNYKQEKKHGRKRQRNRKKKRQDKK